MAEQTVQFLHAIGDTVRLKALDINGVVTALLCSIDGRQYQIAWWHDGVRRLEWLQSFELAEIKRNG